MNVLIACEESQAVCKAFRAKGHTAFSCDIQDQSGGYPEWHIQGDVLGFLDGDCRFSTTDGVEHHQQGRWDMIIAHPPCTYLSNCGASQLFRGGQLNQERYEKGMEAKEFLMKFINADCDKIVVENPVPTKIFGLPKYSQIIQPYEHGHPYQKRTCLWVKGVPLLQPSNIVAERQSTKVAGNWYNKGGKDRQRNRSKTFHGIANAMADQWGKIDVRSNASLHGMWVSNPGDIYSTGRYRCCSVCCNEAFIPYHSKQALEKRDYNYCPSCGAKMDLTAGPA